MILKKFLSFWGEEGGFEISQNNFYDEFMTQFSGKNFGNGMFHIFVKDELEKWTGIAEEAYPELKGNFCLFGYDWLGRMFGISKNGVEENIWMFEIGAANVLVIPYSFVDFLEVAIPTLHEACFATSFYKKWLRKKKTPATYGKCIGYKIPLFAGGKDVIKNMEESDLEVYWYIMTQVKKNLQ